jgi:hypothetical protein
VLITDIVVFVYQKTYKAWTSLLVSICLGLDLIVRLIQLSVRFSPKHFFDQANEQNFCHDFADFLIIVIFMCLFAQWSWIYQVLNNPELA